MGDDWFARSKGLNTGLPSKSDTCFRMDARISRRSSFSRRRREFKSFVISSSRFNLSDSISPRKASVRLTSRRRFCYVASVMQNNDAGGDPRLLTSFLFAFVRSSPSNTHIARMPCSLNSWMRRYQPKICLYSWGVGAKWKRCVTRVPSLKRVY